MLLMAVAVWLTFLCRGYGETSGLMPPFERSLIFIPGYIAFTTVGALIAARKPHNPVGWLFLASSATSDAGWFAEGYWRYALLVRQGELPGGMVMLWVNTRPYTLSSICELLLLLLFPTGRPLTRRWWLAGALVILGALTQVITQALLPVPLDPSMLIINPLGLPEAAGFLQRASDLGAALVILGSLATILSLLLRLRRARGVERQQVKLLIPALVVYMAAQIAVIYTVSRPWEGFSPATNLAFIAQVLGSLLVAGAAGVAILRHHLFDIDLIIRRTLVYAIVTATLGAIYFGAVVLLQALFVRLTGQESALAVVASTLAIAALFQPLRRGVQAIVDRRFDRTRYDARLVLEQFAVRAQREADLDTLSTDLLATVDEALKPEQVTLWLTRR
ncbi:MAG TPA: hypothetical protein VFU22_22755 [Roseiflexaceae bacterium]|nr:hypothetical protein [Roseiflexaceae bacterium]